MGITDSIVDHPFAILFGAIGIAPAIAFGVGGRATSGQLLDRWVTKAEINRQEIAKREAVDDEPRDKAPPLNDPRHGSSELSVCYGSQ
jgi:hypothetical protein